MIDDFWKKRKRSVWADLRAIDYDDDRNYAHDIEQFEYEIAAGDYIPEDCDYDDVEEEDYEDVMDYYYE